MKLFVPLALLAVSAAPASQPRSYLLSIRGIPVKTGENIEAFALQTWGVQFASVCSIPNGWTIKAGASATPGGELEGHGSQGATWFSESSPKELRAFALVTLDGPVRNADIGLPENGVPATFKGTATINTDDGDVKRTLSFRNVALMPASRCPER